LRSSSETFIFNGDIIVSTIGLNDQLSGNADPQLGGGIIMTPVDIPIWINIIVAIGIAILTITVAYFSLVLGGRQLELGENEQVVLYGRAAKPVYGKY